MSGISKFYKVSEKEFGRDSYENIKLPKRATTGSAGYDFYLPYDIELGVGESIVIDTGIRCRINEGWVLQIYPRSGHGFKFGVNLANTVGIIDSDYFNADNEGHIKVKLVNNSCFAKPLKLETGTAFCQGLFIPFGVTEDDETDGIRTGGFGSTTGKE